MTVWGNTVHAFSIYYSEAFNQVIASGFGSQVDDYGVTGILRYEQDRADASFDRIDDIFAEKGLFEASKSNNFSQLTARSFFFSFSQY